jgi:predicted phage terminase large subunit-like protein
MHFLSLSQIENRTGYSLAELYLLHRKEVKRAFIEARAEEARKDFYSFVRLTYHGFQVNWHHKVLCYYLERFARGQEKRLMIFLPPRYSKSELLSRRLPAWIFGNNPNLNIIAASYSADLASRMNRDVQRIMDEDSYGIIFPDVKLNSKNVRQDAQGSWLRNNDIFEVVGHRGVYRSAGIGVGITGMGFDRGIIDDPIKDDKEASSKVVREGLEEWYNTTFYTRKSPDAGICVTMTRWHEDDLAGRILSKAEQDAFAEQWKVIKLPAFCEQENELGEEIYDTLGIKPRKIGEPLWVERFPEQHLLSTRATLGRKFNALYQQSPTALDGDLFKVSFIDAVDAVPAEAQRIRYWDKAGTEGGDGAETAGVLMAKHNGIFYVEDVVHGRYSSYERERVIKQTAERDGVKVHIWQEQEPGSGGKESAELTVKNLVGYSVHTERVSGSKELRAEPFAAQVEAHNVRIKKADWNVVYLEQLSKFPNGKLKDMVDASSGAFNKLAIEKKARLII